MYADRAVSRRQDPACVDFKETLVLLDTATGRSAFRTEGCTARRCRAQYGAGVCAVSVDIRFLNMGFSLDSRYFVVGGADALLAVDVPTREESL